MHISDKAKLSHPGDVQSRAHFAEGGFSLFAPAAEKSVGINAMPGFLVTDLPKDAAAQKESASPQIRNATLRLIFGDRPPESIKPATFQFEHRPRSSRPADGGLGGGLGTVRRLEDGRLSALVALPSELSVVNNLYRDDRNGMSDEQFRQGVVANEVAGKTAAIFLPNMPMAGLEVVSEAVSFQIAGDNWAFRSLVSVMGAHKDFREAGIAAARNYAMLLTINQRSLGETAEGFAEIKLGGENAVENGANFLDRFLEYSKKSAGLEMTAQAILRAHLQSDHKLTAEKAEKFVDQFASRSSANFKKVAENLINLYPPEP